MSNNYVIVYKTADDEIEVITVTGEDPVDAEASFFMVVDENGWAVEEVLSVSPSEEIADEVYEMEDEDYWLDDLVHTNY